MNCLKFLKLEFLIFSSIFACRKDTYSNNCFVELLKSARNVLSDSDRKISKLKI